MDWSYVTLIAIVVSLLLIMIQRVERKRRRLAAIIVAICFLVIWQNTSYQAASQRGNGSGFWHRHRAQRFVLAASRSLQSGRQQRRY